jgi:hypothetical protein
MIALDVNGSVTEVTDADLQFVIDHLQKTNLLRNRRKSVDDNLL